MLRLDKRLEFAMREGAGVNLRPAEAEAIAAWLVALRQIAADAQEEWVIRKAEAALRKAGFEIVKRK